MDPVYCVDFGSTFTKAALVDLDEGRLVGRRWPPDDDRDRCPGRLGCPSYATGTPCREGEHPDPGVLVGRRRPADRGDRERGARHCRGRPSGCTVQWGTRRPRLLERAYGWALCVRAARMSFCWWVEPTGGTRRCCSAMPRRLPMLGGPVRSSWPATSRLFRRSPNFSMRRRSRMSLLTTWFRRSACFVPTGRGRRSARCSFVTSSAASTCPSVPTSPRWCRARRRTSCSGPSSCSRAASDLSVRAPVMSWSSTSGEPPRTCTRWSSWTRRTLRWAERSSPPSR